MTHNAPLPPPDASHYVTYTGASGAALFWGLHMSDLAVMVSALAAICGVLIQILGYLDRRAEVRRGQRTRDDEQT